MAQCPTGELDIQKVFDMYCLLLPPGIARIFVDQLFTLFDGDKSGSIDFHVRLKLAKYLSLQFQWSLIFSLIGIFDRFQHANVRECEGEVEVDI